MPSPFVCNCFVPALRSFSEVQSSCAQGYGGHYFAKTKRLNIVPSPFVCNCFVPALRSFSEVVDIAKNEWNQIESYIFESYHLIQGLKMREIATVS